MPRAWSRRSVLVALGVASATALTGCGVRLEDHARSLPFAPEHKPAPDERTLLAAYVADKAVYECVYEARNRPTWLSIPMAALSQPTGQPTERTR